MKIRLLFLPLYILILCLIAQECQSCTSFLFDKSDQLLLGKNFDWNIGDALLVVNKRNVAKTAIIIPDAPGQPASWTSKYGSVTYDLVGRELPVGGMNECGLAVEGLRFFATEYPPPDLRFYVDPSQWIQYQLDNFSTVEEVITSDSQIRITKASQEAVGFQFFVSDRMGSCAVIAFLDGEMVCYTNETLPIKVVTNSLDTTYPECVEYWEKDEIPVPDIMDVIKRFITAENMMADYDLETSGPPIEYAFNILSNLLWLTPTQFSIVNDIRNLRVYYNTIDSQNIRYVDLNAFDFSCKAPVKVLDIHEDLSGDVSNNFIDYTYEINRDLVEKWFDLPDEALDAIAQYPETTVCTEKDCFIATAVYGSPFEPQVEVFRKFRDRCLLDNALGKAFVQLYKSYSPKLANFIANHDNLRVLVRLSLLPMVGMSWISLKIGFAPIMMLMVLCIALIGNIIIVRKN